MKKLTLTILVAMVPFLMMAQKNKRKNNSRPLVEMKVVKAVQFIGSALSMDDKSKISFQKEITFNPAMVTNTDGSRMNIDEALEIAVNSGYEVYSTNTVLIGGDMLVYFYFMKR
tara:strand:+ start:123 stop:464 length:342 start_codon:yes stop_codon:yes gene_type:complete